MIKKKALVCGVGYNDGKYPAMIGKIKPRQYQLWCNMLHRSYDPKRHIEFPTYKTCEVSDEFLSYSYFYEWCEEQDGYNRKDEKDTVYHLDKDILVKGNKTYSPETCIFVPSAVNVLFTSSVSCRGKYPVGIIPHWNKFRVRCNVNGVFKDFGLYPTVEEAFSVYKRVKEANIRKVADHYKNAISDRVYQALLNYQIEITD